MSKNLSKIIDPFDFTGAQRKEKKAQAAQARFSADAAADAEKLKLQQAESESARMSAEEDQKKKIAQTQEESSRSALSNYLAQEGGTPSRRRFLVGAK